jgi:hypothetical protein
VRRERINTTGADHKRQLNRAEHLRQHVKPTTATASTTAATGTRDDSESLNSTLDRTRYGGRMIAYTAVRQLTVNLGFTLGRNAISAYRGNGTRTPRTPLKPPTNDVLFEDVPNPRNGPRSGAGSHLQARRCDRL